MLITPASYVVQTLQRGRGRAEDDRRVFQVGAIHRQIAGVIAQPLLLLERQVVLLIDNDQPRLGQRGKDRRAGTDDNAGFAITRGDPGVQPLAVIQPGMQNHHRDTEALLKAFHGLRGQANFGNQYQCLASGGQATFNGLQVDFGLATAGYPVEQPGDKSALAGDGVQCGLLLGVGFERNVA